MNETSFVCIGSSEKDCSLKDPVELPRSPVGVNVPDPNISMFTSKGEGREDTLTVEILTLSPYFPYSDLFLSVSFSGEAETEKVTDD